MLRVVLIFIGAFLASVALLGIFIRLPVARHFADMPDHRKVHQTAIPRIGGFGIVLTVLILLAVAQVFELWEPSSKLLLSVAFVSVFLLVAGSLDDIFSLGYRAKFLLQFVVAGVVVSGFGLYFEQVSFLGQLWSVGGLGALISIFWIVGLMNAMNIIDGIDGLAAGVALVGFAGVGALSYAGGAENPLAVCLVLCGATLGFLYYNLQRRRKVFLGDTGSQFLGAMLAVLTLRIHDIPSVNHSIAIPLLLAGYPVLDTSVAMSRRFLKVRTGDLGHRVTRMFLADNDHLHHRLVYAGLTHIQSTFLLLLLASGFAATAVILPRVVWQIELAIMVYLVLAVGFILNRLGFLRRGGMRHALRARLEGVYPGNGRVLYRHTRYYEIFPFPEGEMKDPRSGQDWPIGTRGMPREGRVLTKEF